MKILLTGSSGFLGRHIYNYLASDNLVLTCGRRKANIICDLSSQKPDFANIQEVDCVIHAAGKAHMIPKSHIEAEDFFSVNFSGTKNLCVSLEDTGAIPRSFVFISTVAVYGSEGLLNTKEDAPLYGNSPYAKSKLAAEEWLKEWCKKNDICLTILRLPLLAGPYPPGNLKSMIDGIRTGRYFRIGNGAARKSIVLASDVPTIIPKALEVGGVYNLTDGYHPTFAELEDLVAKQLNKHTPKSIPVSTARILGRVGDVLGSRFPVNSNTIRKITSNMTFDDDKARVQLGWTPRQVLEHFKIS